jgi:hypothetical protein
MPVAADKPNASRIPPRQYAKAIMFDFVNPAGAGRGRSAVSWLSYHQVASDGVFLSGVPTCNAVNTARGTMKAAEKRPFCLLVT